MARNIVIHTRQEVLVPPNTILHATIQVNNKVPQNVELEINHSTFRNVVIPKMTTYNACNHVRLCFVNTRDHTSIITPGSRLCTARYGSTEVTTQDEPTITVKNTRTTADVQELNQYRPINETDLTCSRRTSDVLNLVNKYRGAMWLPGESHGLYKGEQLKIKLMDPKVVNKKQYVIPHAYKEKLNNEIQDMLKNGIISLSKSNYNSPLIVVKKADGCIRPCLDYRALNEVLEPVSFPLPRISEVLSALGRPRFLTSLDLASAYHQTEIAPECRHLTAFTVNNTKYQYNRVPFGLQASPGFFARIINNVLYDLIGPNCIIYMDDILILNDTEEEHLELLEKVFKKLDEEGIKLKIQKCQIFTDRLTFLGYTVTANGLTMNTEKVNAITNMSIPTSKKQTQAFLGVINYYRIFIANFATIAEPLYKLLRKNVPFNWTQEQTNAVNELKRNLESRPVVQFPDYTQKFYIFSDASNVGIGAVLMQKVDGKLHPIAYASKSLNDAQRNYSVTKREALSLVFALESFRNIILLYPIVVYTDHRPLLGALRKPTKDQCLQRWALLIQEYDIELLYIKGTENTLADLLSRLPEDNTDKRDFSQEFDDKLAKKLDAQCNVCNYLPDYIPVKQPWSERELRNAQKNDKKCIDIKANIDNQVDQTIPTGLMIDSKIINGILYIVRRIKRATLVDQYLVIYVPDSLMKRAFETIHSDVTAGHNGVERTLKIFRKNYYNFRESTFIKEMCQSCELCIRAKATPKLVPISTYPIPTNPFHTIASDILGPLRITEKGNRYVLTVRDYTTRYTILFAMPYKETNVIIDALRQVIANFGSSHILITDNAPEYKSEKLVRFLKLYNTLKKEITPFHPASQGLSERINREVVKLLRIYCTEFALNDWDTLLPVVQLAINNSYNTTISETPFYALLGYDSATTSLAPPKLDYSQDELQQHLKRIAETRLFCREALLKNQSRYTEYTNTTRQPKDITVGQRVFARIDKHRQQPKTKLDLPVSGPFKVLKKRQQAWQLLEVGSNKTYIVHPDYIVTRPPTAKAKVMDESVKVQEDSTDPETDSEDSEPIPSQSQSGHRRQVDRTNKPDRTGPPSSNKPTRIQPHRACKK